MFKHLVRGFLATSIAIAGGLSAAQAQQCERTVEADVVALDQPLMFNRLGAQNVNGMMFALREDVRAYSSNGVEVDDGVLRYGQVRLRSDKRPRPLVLRVNVGECLRVNFENLLSSQANQNNANPRILTVNDQVTDRTAGFTPMGLALADDIRSSSSFVGRNENSLVQPGQSATYTFYAEEEGEYLVVSNATTFGGEGAGGNIGNGLFGAVVVEPRGAKYYRSQVTEEEMRLATIGTTSSGHPIIDYEATYPDRSPWDDEGKAGKPILSILQAQGGNAKIVHNEINAMIVGPNADGSFPAETYPLEAQGKRNPALPNRLEAFREFVVIFHDESVSAQAFPNWYGDPVFEHTLHGVGDNFMINYGAAGVGSEVISNRLGVGPMHDCLSCAYEEFFLSSFTIGDPAMLVDVPANTGLEYCSPQPGDPNCERDESIRATYAKYPADPSNVSHSYIGDFVKFRNLHAGPKEHHIFHLHNHQWLSNPDDDNSNYLDAQSIGPGGAYTYEIAFGGSGNRNHTAGDAIYHCHFYPHFAQGMWALWRNHDVFESGTKLVSSSDLDGLHTEPYAQSRGMPASGARALPDGEIVAGVPIPALLPLPGKAMAPMPAKVFVEAVDKDGDGTPESSQARIPTGEINRDPSLIDNRTVMASLPQREEYRLNPNGLKNPGYPFWIAGIDSLVGQRTTTPPLDMFMNSENPTEGGWDGGLPRHALEGYTSGGRTHSEETRLSFAKHIDSALPVYFPETGTEVERAAMAFHARRSHETTRLMMNGTVQDATFTTNGALPTPGAPFFEPCMDDRGEIFNSGSTGYFFSGEADGIGNTGVAEYGADNPRVYKAANIQMDVVFNKAGDHYPQQRILTLWDDVAPTLNKTRPPEPFVFRLNTFECANYYQTNLVPEFYYVDDYQVTTPTDVIGQHIHLPKWDLVAADGAGNGWNYEDGVLGAESVRVRIEAINRYVVENDLGYEQLQAEPHPYFGSGSNGEYLGARTNIQRWFVDPLHNVQGIDRGLGITFTHDHFGPSTHQQVGLYATLLINPAGSKWLHNETGEEMYTRHDGGPTSWQAIILAGDIDNDGSDDSYREFYFEAQDFAHAYNRGVYSGVDENGVPIPVSDETFRYALNPSHRQSHSFPDAARLASVCPGGVPRPCPEAVSAADIGTFLINYRNEPVGYRVYDPNKIGPDNKRGSQADGPAGDLAFALQTRTDRVMREFNTRVGASPYPELTGDIRDGDPFTPIMRANAGDLIKVRMQGGAHEHEHGAALNGVKWLEGGAAFGAAPNSGWKASMQVALSEKASFATSIFGDVDQARGVSDYLYVWDASQEGFWTGTWGVLRSYDTEPSDLASLPNNPRSRAISIANRREFNGVCPVDAEVVSYDISAVAVNDVTSAPADVSIIPSDYTATMHVGAMPDAEGGTLLYNTRGQRLNNGEQGPLHDPTALVYVPTEDLQKDIVSPVDRSMCRDSRGGVANPRCPVKVAEDYTFEPLVLRVNAGQCLEVTVRNRLPEVVPDLASFVTQHYTVIRDRENPNGPTTFNNNLIRASSHVGFHTQLMEYDISRDDGMNVGINPVQTVAPGASRTYRYYAGDLELGPRAGNPGFGALNGDRFDLVANPVEFGAAPITPADPIKQGQKGLFGQVHILPAGSTFVADPGTRVQGTVTLADGETTFRDFAMVFHKAVNLRYRDGSPVPNIAGEGFGVPEDAHDAGASAINYKAEPLWFRFGFDSGADWGMGGGHGPEEAGAEMDAGMFGDLVHADPSEAGLATIPDMYRAYSNSLTGGDPETPIYNAAPGEEMRFRVTMPAGYARGTTLGIIGHNWTDMPFITKDYPSDTMAYSPSQRQTSTQDNILPPAAWNILTTAGGPMKVSGDYLYRDLASFGNQNGLWGIVRVEGTPVETPAPATVEPVSGGTTTEAETPETTEEAAPVVEEEPAPTRRRGRRGVRDLFGLLGGE